LLYVGACAKCLLRSVCRPVVVCSPRGLPRSIVITCHCLFRSVCFVPRASPHWIAQVPAVEGCGLAWTRPAWFGPPESALGTRCMNQFGTLGTPGSGSIATVADPSLRYKRAQCSRPAWREKENDDAMPCPRAEALTVTRSTAIEPGPPAALALRPGHVRNTGTRSASATTFAIRRALNRPPRLEVASFCKC
jgi:hypothetical protein